jgi:hypothetical protein
MSSIFTNLRVGILHSQSAVNSSVPCGYLLFTVLYVTLLYVYVQYVCVQYIRGLSHSRLGTADHVLTHVAHVTTAVYSLQRAYA